MAELRSIQSEIQLSLRLLGRSLDPFQKDLEWFEYELAVEDFRRAELQELEGPALPKPGRFVVRGKMNRKDFNELVRSLDTLMARGIPMRFEPDDLNFYFEWSHETPNVYLIVTWFDLALLPRHFEQRFPTAHAGFRFLADKDALLGFRSALEGEFVHGARVTQPKSSTLIN